MTTPARPILSFPNPVNEVAARVVAGGVGVESLVILLFDVRWCTLVLFYGFVARVASGPRFSPLALLATRVIVPRLGLPERPVPGPPKRFAQGIGVVFSAAAAILLLGLGLVTAGRIVLGVLIAFAALESVLGFCMGCTVFAALIRAGVIPDAVCERCNDIWASREPRAPAAAPQS